MSESFNLAAFELLWISHVVSSFSIRCFSCLHCCCGRELSVSKRNWISQESPWLSILELGVTKWSLCVKIRISALPKPMDSTNPPTESSGNLSGAPHLAEYRGFNVRPSGSRFLERQSEVVLAAQVDLLEHRTTCTRNSQVRIELHIQHVLDS